MIRPALEITWRAAVIILLGMIYWQLLDTEETADQGRRHAIAAEQKATDIEQKLDQLRTEMQMTRR